MRVRSCTTAIGVVGRSATSWRRRPRRSSVASVEVVTGYAGYVDDAWDNRAILRRIARNAAEHGVEHRVIFGFSYQSAGALVEFLKVHQRLRQVTGVRYSGELGHPFHVVDDETVVLPLDNPFVKEGRFASLLVRDRELADSLAEGFHELWRNAMKSLREIQVDPRGHKA